MTHNLQATINFKKKGIRKKKKSANHSVEKSLEKKTLDQFT